jgi:tetratricopeptide (TPR) repeat protein
VGKGTTEWLEDQVKTGLGTAASANTLCVLGEWFRARFTEPKPPDKSRFTVLVAQLSRDTDGTFTRHVLDAFRGAHGFKRVENCIAIDAGTSDDSEGQAVTTAERLRVRHGADLLVWGEVADARDRAIRIWFTAADQRPDFSVRPWRFEGGALEAGFSKEFATALQAVALSGVRDPFGAENQLLVDAVRSLLPRLRTLLNNLAPGLGNDARSQLEIAAASGLFAYGSQIGDADPIREAIAVYERVLERSSTPASRARLNNDLGIMLVALTRFGDDEALPRARRALEAATTALQEHGTSREQAFVLVNLGMVLTAAGVRGDFPAYAKALNAYERALNTLSREKEPELWAVVQNNLGTLLTSLAIRQQRKDFARRAVASSEAVIEVLSLHSGSPIWATAQLNLGNALGLLGGVNEDRRAAGAFDAALRVISRERDPLTWAGLQSSRGNALKALAAVDGETALAGAIDAYNQALLEYTRNRTPKEFGYVKNNLGLAFQIRASLGHEAALQKAVQAHKDALSVLTRDVIPQDWAVTQIYLGSAFLSLGVQGDSVALREAANAFEAALTEIPREHMPIAWAQAQWDLATALRAMADVEALRRAVAAFEAALQELQNIGAVDSAKRVGDELERARTELSSAERKRS